MQKVPIKIKIIIKMFRPSKKYPTRDTLPLNM